MLPANKTTDNAVSHAPGQSPGESSPDISFPAATHSSALIARLERVPFSWWHMRARIVMGSATFLDAFDALSLAFVLPVLVALWNISPQQIGFLIGASYIGQLVGALLFSRLAERFGRVYMAAGATLLMSAMSLGCALSGNFAVLFACRLVQGIGVGGEMPVAAAYISELSKAERPRSLFLAVRDDLSCRADDDRTGCRPGSTGVWMEDTVFDRRHSRAAGCIAAAALA